jgi:integrase
MYQLLWATGLRVAEFTSVTRTDIDLEARTLLVRQGKGSKDRVVPVPEQLVLALRMHMDATPQQRFLFETTRRSRYSVRYVQHLTRCYGKAAGIDDMHPHRFRHTILTVLTRAKLSDAQVQIVSGHATKKSLEVYQSLALRDVQDDYQQAMDEAMRRARGK